MIPTKYAELVEPGDTVAGTNRAVRRSAVVTGVGILVRAVLAGAAYVGVIQGLITKATQHKRPPTSWPPRACSASA